MKIKIGFMSFPHVFSGNLRTMDSHFRGNDKYRRAFTLVELLIVLVIISIVAAISTISALSMKLQANEGMAKASLKTIASACESYASVHTLYPADLKGLGVDYVSSDLVDGKKGGYNFSLASGNEGYTFTAVARPEKKNFSGIRSYCVNNLNAMSAYVDVGSIDAIGDNCPAGGSPLG